jgi:hypothetical protein
MMGKFLTLIFGFLGVIAIVVLISLLLIKLGWYLFMVPVFGLPDITWLQAFGLSLLTSTFRSSNYKSKD